MLNPQDKPTVDDIFAAVEEHMQIPRKVICSERKALRVTLARAVWCWLIYHVSELSFPQIGRLIDKDHSTVVRAVRRVERDRVALDLARVIKRELLSERKAVAG